MTTTTTTATKEAKKDFTLVNRLYKDLKRNAVYRVTAYNTETNELTLKLEKAEKGSGADAIRHVKLTLAKFDEGLLLTKSGALNEIKEETLTPKKSARVAVACKNQSVNASTYENAVNTIDSAVVESGNDAYKISVEDKKKRVCIKYYRGESAENICELWIKTRNNIMQYFGIAKIAIKSQAHYNAEGKVIDTSSWRFSIYHEWKLEEDTIKNAVLEIIRKHEEAIKANA